MASKSDISSSIRSGGPLIFLHIPKTGGTSLVHMLKPHFSPENVYRVEVSDKLNISSNTYDNPAVFMHGHVDWSMLQKLETSPRVISMLREPVSRALSLYWYWRSFSWSYAEKTNDAGIYFAKSVNMESFFNNDSPGIRANFENAATRQLCGAAVCAPHIGFFISDADVIALAKARIDSMVVCGVSEYFRESTELISDRLNLPLLPIRTDNVTSSTPRTIDFEPIKSTKASEDVISRIKSLTKIDTEIYKYALMNLLNSTSRL